MTTSFDIGKRESRSLNADAFYDKLAGNYHFLYQDWEDAIRRQSEVIARFFGYPPVRNSIRVLDCACGIGTQTIGLARLGYPVVGVDLSRKAVARARRELRKRNIHNAAVAVADMRNLPQSFHEAFDAVICCDNPLAHMLTNDDLYQALHSMAGTLRKDGKLLVTTRDYDSILETRPSQMPIRKSIVANRTTLVFQLWNWQPDGQTYINEHFMIQRGPMSWKVRHLVTPMKAHKRVDIMKAAETAGLVNIEWMEREATEYFQPIMIGRKPI
jgi:glycine/sarcosine N-methyltransferase